MIEVGKTYDVNHSRKGKFRAKVTAINGDMVDCEIITGKAKMLSSWNDDVMPGECLTIRSTLASFTEVSADAS